MDFTEEIAKQERQIEKQKSVLFDLEGMAEAFKQGAEQRLQVLQAEITESRRNLERQTGALLILRQMQEQGGDANGGEAEVVGKAGT